MIAVFNENTDKQTKEHGQMNKITPFLWFDNQVEEAMNYYLSIFRNARILTVSRYPDGSPRGGEVISATFELDGQVFMALNAGPQFKFTEAISFFINCETQAEVDELWEKLTQDGEESECGWLKDKFGLSWQIVPSALGKMLGDSNPQKANNVMNAMLKMRKIDVAVLEQAYNSAS